KSYYGARKRGAGASSRAPFPRVQGGATKGEERCRGRRTRVQPPSARMGKGGTRGACPRVPRADGAGRGGVGGSGEGGRHALAHPPSARMGKGGAGDRVPSRAPLPRVRGGAANGRREVPGASCPRAPLHGKGGGGERGRGRGRRRRALVCTPSVRMGGAAKGEGVEPKARGRRAIVRRLSARTGWRGQRVSQGKGRGAACPRAPPLSTREGAAVSAGEGKRRAGTYPRAPPFCARTGGRSMRGKGKMREGATYPARDEGEVLLRPLFDANRGGRRGWEEGGGGWLCTADSVRIGWHAQ
ncbi:hypothetical protein EDB84DRAFT_1642466, partial [Lactarius hengduanensis]